MSPFPSLVPYESERINKFCFFTSSIFRKFQFVDVGQIDWYGYLSVLRSFSLILFTIGGMISWHCLLSLPLIDVFKNHGCAICFSIISWGISLYHSIGFFVVCWRHWSIMCMIWVRCFTNFEIWIYRFFLMSWFFFSVGSNPGPWLCSELWCFANFGIFLYMIEALLTWIFFDSLCWPCTWCQGQKAESQGTSQNAYQGSQNHHQEVSLWWR